MKIKELKQKSPSELANLLQENRRKIGQFKFDLGSKKTKNVREARESRKEVARILTLLNKKDNESR